MKILIQEDFDGEWVVVYVNGEKFGLSSGHGISDRDYRKLLEMAGAEVIYKTGRFVDDDEDNFQEE